MKDKMEDTYFDQEELASVRRGRRRKQERSRAVLTVMGCLVAMVAVIYFTATICVWIDGRVNGEEQSGAPGNIGGSQDGEANQGGEDIQWENDGLGTDQGSGEASGTGTDQGSEEASGADSKDVIGAASNKVVYSQEELEHQVENAREQAVEEVLGSIRNGLSDGETVLQTLRPLYQDELVVYSSGKYHFIPINHQLKKNQWDESCLDILESGEYRYLQDGEVISYKGIDVSRHQGKIDWNQVAEDGVTFAFIRVGYRGYGTGKLVGDEYFEDNIKGAIAAGIKVGVYFYSQAINEEEVLEEANYVLEKIAPYQIDCPVAFDVEKVTGASGRMNEISVEERTRLTEIFCQEVEKSGYRSIIYYNTEMGALLLDLPALENYDKWFASYSDEFYYPYEYGVWQYSQTGSVKGIKGDVDLNISFSPLWEE
jgi:GH25 family lysozyme M1 (1,4-beta-N-acetylmuramidase)